MARFYTINPGLAFYDDAAGPVPAGAIPITQNEIDTLMKGQATGQRIVLQNGIPTLITVAIDNTSKVPTQVSMYQAQRLLYEMPGIEAGTTLYDSVSEFISTADFPTQLAWNKATVITRDSPLMKTIATALNLTDSQVDEMFIEAAKIIA